MNKHSLSKTIFTYLAETSKDLTKLGVAIVLEPYEFLPKGKYSLTSRQRRDKIGAMKRTQYFKQESSSSHRYLLTSQGRVAAIKLRVVSKLKRTEKEWDGFWRIVTYDVAELTRRQRDLLRGQLKSLGFLELQKSTWVIPASIENELYILLQLWNIEIRKGDVRVILAKTITRDQDVKRYFGFGS